jgi:enterochelin esterase-like enzyme
VVVSSMSSASLGGPVSFHVHLPNGYSDTGPRLPVVYLLHGRGSSMQDWSLLVNEADRLVAQRRMRPTILVMPDAPWLDRAGWYVDSVYAGAEDRGRAVETALASDLVAHVDATYRTSARREHRVVGGLSMGGAGALRFALAHQSTFSAAIVLSPAVYVPRPPSNSNCRPSGAFGVGSERFVQARYAALSYPTLLPDVDPRLPLQLFVAAGDREYAGHPTGEADLTIPYQTALLHKRLIQTPGISVSWRILGGGHDWDVWLPGFVEAFELFLPPDVSPPLQ